jgi:hypothetical protein
VEIEIRVPGLQWVKGPLNAAKALLECVFTLSKLQGKTYASAL